MGHISVNLQQHSEIWWFVGLTAALWFYCNKSLRSLRVQKLPLNHLIHFLQSTDIKYLYRREILMYVIVGSLV